MERQADKVSKAARDNKTQGPKKRSQPNLGTKARRDSGPTDASDPITGALGGSTRLGPVLSFRWPSKTTPYLTEDTIHAMKRAAAFAAARSSVVPSRSGGSILIEVRDVVRAIVGLHLIDSESRWSADLNGALRRADIPMEAIIDDDARKVLSLNAEAIPYRDAILRWDVVTVLAEASRIRQRTDANLLDIGMRHIIVGAFFSTEGQLGLREAGLFCNGFQIIRDALVKNLSRDLLVRYGDDRKVWENEFNRLRDQSEVIGPIRSHSRPAYDSDAVLLGEGDPLGAAADAKALSDLILLEGLHPPLAIGLFGPWGSGKSTLIRRLRQEIDDQTAEERKLPLVLGERDELARVRRVIQLEFNAWTFADSENLWTSFTAEIFDQLAAGGATWWKASHGSKLLSKIRSRLADEARALKTATTATDTHTLEIEEANRRIAEGHDAKRLASLQAAWETARDLATESGVAPKKSKPVYLQSGKSAERNETTAFEAFRDGILGSAPATSGRWETIGRSLMAVGRASFALWRRVARFRPMATAALIGVSTLIILLAVGHAWIRVPSPAWLEQRSLTVAAFAATAINLLWPTVRMFGLFLDKRRSARDTALGRIAEAQQSLHIAEDSRRKAETERERHEGFVNTYGGDLDAQPKTVLQYLFAESDDVNAVRAQAGLLATVRRCFHQLDAVLKQMRSDPKERDAVIDRIVLYIDDLDRCSAEQVVEILQVVHLLLAFESFVVIVAVDASWLKRSLSQVHDQFLGAEDVAGQPTVEDYLEKIFQIPFWVRPLIDPDAPAGKRYVAYENYVDHLLGDRASAPDQQSAKVQETPVRAKLASTQKQSARVLGLFEIADPPAPHDLEAPRRERVTLTAEEHGLIRSLGALAAKSPRSVKRMINIYRLIRVQLSSEDLAHFLDASSQFTYGGTLFALACEIGLSPPLLAIVHSTLPQVSAASWDAFTSSLNRQLALQADDPTVFAEDQHLAALRSGIAKSGKWIAFRESLASVGRQSGVPMTLAQLVTGFEEVRRYSFRA